MSARTMSVAGSFYPVSAYEINEMINHFNTILEGHPDELSRFNTLSGDAIIVPHAGWVYSGFTANIAFRLLAHTNPKTVVVIGPSHRVGFDGVSIADNESYQTPLGNLAMDTVLVRDLKSRFSLPTFAQAHHEHSTEVQMPFIKHYLNDTKVIELVYGYAQSSQISPIIDYLLNLPDTSVVISTDLSHYYSLEEAKQLDSICLEAIRTENVQELHQGCEACGIIGVEAMLSVANKRALKSVLLDYRTSADASGDTAKVVGYASAVFS
ncbi:MAG: AmmeMemoRadiSam system protein B [Campylobacterales bacterium]|nr:AmmeMemoRadiSam system protein B [Campylobacterales bacterium]